jgi:hypothetical protein
MRHANRSLISPTYLPSTYSPGHLEMKCEMGVCTTVIAVLCERLFKTTTHVLKKRQGTLYPAGSVSVVQPLTCFALVHPVSPGFH